MKMDEQVKRRFSELAEKANVVANARVGDMNQYTNSEKFREWATSVMNLLQRVFGENNVHYQTFYEQYKKFSGWPSGFESCRGIFQAAREDYEGGYLFNIRALTKAEVLDDVLEQASELLRAGYKDPACVLCGVALEITLKELCTRQGVSHGKLDGMNTDLCKAGVYNMAMQKQVTAWAARRNDAAHGNWSAYVEADVDDFIKGVTRFMADYL